ncbi:collagen alpha-6(VI) chain-like, partial [Dendronephthya gigantea]|uniref:collagen alpha-6(VI) chain-like n=1 Tax=Dendronephthya gigantea TaxID=151771 RepID=UPI00106BFB5F
MQQTACSSKTMITLVKLGTCVSGHSVDMVYLTDFSGEQRQAMLTKTYTFFQNLLNFFDFSSSRSRLGVVKYSSSHSWVRMFTNGQDLASLRSFIQNTPNNPYRKPLETILSELHGNFTTMLSNGYPRSAIPKVLIVASDGRSIVDRQQFEQAAKALKDLGVMIVIFGVGGRSYFDKMSPAASSDRYRFWARYEIQVPLETANVANAIILGLQSCQWMRCQYHSYCIQHRIGRAECVCPLAGDHVDPVCGSNGKTYINNEVLIQDSCRRKTFITSQRGACVVGACRSFTCNHYSFCELNSVRVPKCVCPTSCSSRLELVCGSNGQVYENECALRRWSCQNQLYVTVAYTGPCKSGPIDVVFAIDGSSKTDPSRFVQMKNFLRSIVSYLPLSRSEVNVGVVEYSDKQYEEIKLNEYYNMESLREAIRLIKPSEGATSRIGEVIKFVREQIFLRDESSRSGVRKVLVILTDGNEYTEDNPQSEADLIMKSGVRVLGVAVGNQPNLKSFSRVISPTENLYAVNQAGSLGRLVPSVARDILRITKAASGSLLDIAFIVDGSGDSSPQFEDIKYLVKTFVSTLDVGSDKDHVGIVEYGNTARIVLPFDWLNNVQSINQFIDGIRYSGGSPRLDRALAKTRELFKIERGYRPGVSKVAVLVANSQFDGQDTALQQAVQELRRDGIRLYVIGSNKPDENRLQTQ